MQVATEAYCQQDIAPALPRFLTYVTFVWWTGVLYFQDEWSNHANRIVGHDGDAAYAVDGPCC